jgi:hypothetical protein
MEMSIVNKIVNKIINIDAEILTKYIQQDYYTTSKIEGCELKNIIFENKRIKAQFNVAFINKGNESDKKYAIAKFFVYDDGTKVITELSSDVFDYVDKLPKAFK